ncbi:MAG: FecR domain-containing protein, partial [Candidatus Marinimicrobia bacterium]|nr:FecR domain-containing protein [Candidatus Neomarinimicrobiota bacterium]
MRKIIVFVISLIIIFSVVVQAQTQFATILKKSGVVNIRPKGETDFSIPAEVSMGLNIGDALKTYEAGYAALLFTDDKSLIKIRKNSEIEIREEFSTRTIKISEGRLLAKITPGITTSYRIATPTSVASVKGTEFWVMTSPDYGDRFYGIEGLVQVINLITGMESMLEAGQMIISTLDGQLLNIPIEPEDMPVDIEEESPPPDIEEEVTPPELEEEVFVPGEEVTVPPTSEMAATTEEEVPPEHAAKKASKPYGMGLGLGSVTIDGVIYNQIALRPEVKFGKFGVGLDVVLYMDDKGKIRENEWDE